MRAADVLITNQLEHDSRFRGVTPSHGTSARLPRSVASVAGFEGEQCRHCHLRARYTEFRIFFFIDNTHARARLRDARASDNGDIILISPSVSALPFLGSCRALPFSV
jgi:hypothetical protein